jgi:Na+/H+ antiporter NhaD/arsenite permease-like protein
MTIVIVTILLIGFFLIATEKYTNVNKAAVAIFVGTLGWILYISYGTDFVMSQHASDYQLFLGGAEHSSSAVKQFIAQNVLLKYVGKASEIVLFLLATMTIVEILQNNGCFDFLTQLMRTRSSKRLLVVMSVVTFVISANLDNLTTTVMMLTIMHGIVVNHKQRMIFGCAIVISANCGGALTVIGSPIGLVLWNMGAITASHYSASLAIPCLLAWAIPVVWLSRSLSERVEMAWVTLPYRGDDTNLNVWQRLLMLFVGIGGLWFIPTFHNITKLSPFLGALCVLAVLWIVNEVVNRKLMNTDEMIQRRIPRALQYGVIQMILFVLGIMLAVGVVSETGVMHQASDFISANVHNLFIIGAFTEALSCVLDNFATAMTMISLPDATFGIVDSCTSAQMSFDTVCNGNYWNVVAFASAVGGNILCTGSMSGLALMKMERIRFGWYLRNVGWKALVGSVLGLAVCSLL